MARLSRRFLRSMSRPSRWNGWDAAFLGASVSLFLARFLIGWQAHQVPHPDETDLLAPIWGFLTQSPVLLARVGRESASLWGVRIPLLFGAYDGPYDGYLSIPFLCFWGNTMRALVYRNAFFGSLAVASLYRCARRLFGRRSCALAAALLLANAAWFVLACRFGVFVSIACVSMGLLAISDLAEWLEDDRPWAAVRAFAWLGLGACTRAWFWGLLPGLALCALAHRGMVRAAWSRARSRRPGFSLLCAGAFLIWTVPWAIANVNDGWVTVRFFAACLQRRGPASLFNGSVLAWRLRERLWQLWRLESASDWTILLTGSPSVVLGWIREAPTAVVSLAIVLEAEACCLSRNRRAGKLFGALFLIVATDVLLSLLSPNDFSPNHLYPVLPLFYLFAAALPCFWPGPGERSRAWLVTAALLIASGVQSSVVLAAVRRGLDRTGGVGVDSSAAVLDLTEWLRNHPADKPVFLQYRNFASNVLYFSGGAVDPIVVDWDKTSRGFRDPAVLNGIVRGQTNALFVLAHCHEPCADAEQPSQSVLPAFQDLVGKAGGRLIPVKGFPSRDGQTVYDAYRVSAVEVPRRGKLKLLVPSVR